ncbi:MAG: hypothetical protein WC653_04515 [Candidatus Gracilibacteria bacterium]
MAEEKKNLNRLNDQEVALPDSNESEQEVLDTDSNSKNVLDELEDAGGLEVEDMPESNELQERRRKTKSRLKELSNVEGENADGDVFGEEEPGVMDLLREVNLSARHLKFCCGGVLGIAILIGLFFGGRTLLNYWQGRSEGTPEEDGTTEGEQEQTGLRPGEDYSFLDPSILSGILVGEDEPEEDPATQAGENLGDTVGAGDALSMSINDFAKIFESLQVDVNEMLNQTSDRSGALKDYENELGYLIYLAEQNLEDLSKDSDNLVQQFTMVEETKAEQEARFFEKLSDLDTPAAIGALDTFIAEGEEIVRLRAQYNARQKLISFYEQALEVLKFRLNDIQLNEEALVKGVQVVDLEGSTLNLIIEENEL